jgi:hypothetical protein
MDFRALQKKLFELDPTDPKEDLARLRAQAQGSRTEVAPTKDYVNESVEVPQGSMPLGLDNLAHFAALAGVKLNETQRTGPAGQAKGKDPMPATSKPSRTGEQPHPLKDKLVGEVDSLSGGDSPGGRLHQQLRPIIENFRPDLDSTKVNDLTVNVVKMILGNDVLSRSASRPTPAQLGPLDNLRNPQNIESDIKERLYAALAKKGIR